MRWRPPPAGLTTSSPHFAPVHPAHLLRVCVSALEGTVQ